MSYDMYLRLDTSLYYEAEEIVDGEFVYVFKSAHKYEYEENIITN